MAISDSQKVDLLYKKLFGVTKTDLPANKSPSNESIASPHLTRGDTIWQQSSSIPAIATAVSEIVESYQTTTRIQCVADTTSTPIGSVYPSWKTNLIDWIPSEFGATYFVKVYADTAAAADPTVTGTQLSDSGIAGVGEWNFDYQAGVLNFIGGTIPAALTAGKVVYITGYRYIGLKGLSTFTNVSIGNAQVTNFSTGNAVISGGYFDNIANITAVTGNINQLNTTVANITDLTGTSISVTNVATAILTSITANITAANVITGNIDTLNTTTGNITTLSGTSINVVATTTTEINSTSGNITNSNVHTLNVSIGNITSGNSQIWYTTELNSTQGNITSGNSQIWYTTELNSTQGNITSGNSLVWYSTYLNSTVGNINAIGSEFIDTVNLNSTQGNIPTLVSDNFSSSNVQIIGGSLTDVSLSGIAGITATGNVTAPWFIGNVAGRIGNYSQVVNTPILYAGGNSSITSTKVELQNIRIVGNTIRGTSGNLIISADLTDSNHVVIFDSVSAFGIPSGTNSQRPGDPGLGYVRYNINLGTIEWWTGVTWGSAVNTITSEMLYPDGVNNIYTLGQVASTNGILVNINGTIQQAGVAYIVTSNQITFSEIPLSTDIIEIRYLAAGVASADYYGGPVGGAVHVLDTTNSTSPTTGALIVDGGMGIANDVHVAGTIYGTVVGTIEVAGGINGTVIGNTNPETGGFSTLITTGNVNLGGNTTVIGNIVPAVDSLYTLGNVDYRFKDIWLSGTSIYLGDATISTDLSGGVVLPAGSSVGGTPVDSTLSQHDADITTLYSNATSQAQSISSINSSVIIINNNIISLRANIAAANLVISTLNTESNSYQAYANANIGTLHLGNISTNANIGILHLGNISTNANLGAYQTYANANAISQQTAINSLSTGANTNTAAYLAGTITVGNITATGTTILQGNVQITGEGEFITNNLIVGGNLYVKGNTTTIDAVSVTTRNLAYVAASNAATAAAADGAGIITPYSALTFKNATSSWQSNVSITPSANLSYNLGGEANYWATVFAGNVVSNAHVIGAGGIISTSNIAVNTATAAAITTTTAVAEVFNSGASTLRIGGAASVISLGAPITSALTFNATAGSLVPGANATVNLGSSTAYWGTVFAGNHTGNTAVFNAGTANAAVLTGNVWVSGNILPFGANMTYNLGSTTQWWNTFYGVSTQAKYADLAENYVADADYSPGTVVVFGGTAEITVTTQDHDTRIAGVISTNPAYLMNAAVPGLPLALQGRAPCMVLGPVCRGDLLVSSTTAGVAQKLDKVRFDHGCVIGKSLEDINSAEIKLIEIVVGLR